MVRLHLSPPIWSQKEDMDGFGIYVFIALVAIILIRNIISKVKGGTRHHTDHPPSPDFGGDGGGE